MMMNFYNVLLPFPTYILSLSCRHLNVVFHSQSSMKMTNIQLQILRHVVSPNVLRHFMKILRDL